MSLIACSHCRADVKSTSLIDGYCINCVQAFAKGEDVPNAPDIKHEGPPYLISDVINEVLHNNKKSDNDMS